MDIEHITEKLNEYTNNEFGFIIRSAKLHENSCTLEFGYNDGTILNTKKRQECYIFLLKMLPSGFIYDIKFIKNYVTEETVKKQIKDIALKNFPALVYEVGKVMFKDEKYVVELLINEKVENYAKSKNINKILEEKLKEIYLTDFAVDFVIDNNIGEITDFDDDDLDIEPQQEHLIEITEISSLCGEKVLGPANYIKDFKNPNPNMITFCGTIKFIKSFEMKKKNKPEEHNLGALSENDEANNENSQQTEKDSYVRKYYKFVLKDFSGEINCIYFANKTTQSNVEKLDQNSQIIANGIVEEDKFSGGVTFRVKNISLCVLPTNFVEPVIYKPEPDHYRYVFPEAFISQEQVDLFSVINKPINEVAPYLKNHEVVVFDFETTGLSATDCKIIEIGAVKIQNGKITEQFETFVNPQEHIADDSTKIHGIVDSDVCDAPTYPQALADFYKFTRNSTLVAYNISFDYSFLSLYGKDAGYNFDNPQIDALKLAVKNVKGVKNYKLKTIADKLGVLLDNAHRAVYDAIATAEVFIKLAKFIEEE